MRAWPLLALLIACGGGGGSAKPSAYTHDEPSFALEAPPGWKAVTLEDPLGGKMLRFDGPHASESLILSWHPAANATAIEERDSLIQTHEATGGAEITAKGDLAGSGAWMQTTNPMGDLVEAYLRVGDTMIECQGNGKAVVISACKSLRPR